MMKLPRRVFDRFYRVKTRFSSVKILDRVSIKISEADKNFVQLFEIPREKRRREGATRSVIGLTERKSPCNRRRNTREQNIYVATPHVRVSPTGLNG